VRRRQDCGRQVRPFKASEVVARPAGILAQSNHVPTIQVFGIKNSQATRAAERFFKERRVAIQSVDLKRKPMSPGEIKRFIDRFGLLSLLDTEGTAYADAGLKYLKQSSEELRLKIEQEPRLLRLPLVRAGNLLSVGHDEDAWKGMLGAV
jgi:arsenate reductase-like glutaredoxin family protein